MESSRNAKWYFSRYSSTLQMLALCGFFGCGNPPAFIDKGRLIADQGSAQTTARNGTHPGTGIDGNAQGGSQGDDQTAAGGSGLGHPGALDPATVDKLKRLPKFGLLVNDLKCGLCHVSIVGDVASTRDVPPLWAGTYATVDGSWFAAGAFDGLEPAAPSTGTNVVTASGGIKTNYAGPELPVDASGKPAFPDLDITRLVGATKGSVEGPAPFPLKIDKVYRGNAVLVGTQDAPIKLSGDVLIEGDLVIKGWYSGVGTIYATGNIYIPADLRAVRSAFPFDDDQAKALVQANARVANTDALGLATAKSVFLADLNKHQNSDKGNEDYTVYHHPDTPANRTAEALGVYDIWNWFPGGQSAYDNLYENAVNCVDEKPTQIASFNMIEAFIYAHNTVAGVSRRASYTIRGGVVADYYHVISGASACGNAAISPVHGRPSDRSYIEYDYRLKTGELPILEHLAELFPKAGASN